MSGTGDQRKPMGRDMATRTVDPKLLEMLACPLTKASLRWNAEKGELISP